MKVKITGNSLMNDWLVPNHGITIEEVFEKYPHYKYNSRQFYLDYAVSEEAHDKWYEETIEKLSKKYRWSKKRTREEFAFAYLNLAPAIKKDA